MRVLLITPFRHYCGGVESVNEMLLSSLEEDGHVVDFLTSEKSPYNDKWKPISRLVGLPAITARAFKDINNDKYDLVIANGEFSWGIDHPFTICIFHGSYYGFRNSLKSYISFKQYLGLSWLSFIQRQASKGKNVIAVSNYIAGVLNKQGISVERIIENSIDTNKFSPDYRNKKSGYLFVGNYNEYGKGFDVLNKMAEMGMQIDCISERPSDYHRYNSNISFLGTIDNNEMPEMYKKYKILVFPSRFEAAGLVVLEAMSSGMPVVMTDVGIGHDLMKDIPEFVVGLSSKNLVKDFISHVANIESDYEKFSQKAREYVVNRYSYNRFKSEWQECIRSFVKC